ncbi:SIR2 family NAD-dependent protein deacylase [Paraburkholderia ultramafica]|uniref:SIR2 family NAD-dependent protein deacylase n=1 Tax=Paraburkholderia ultramafica TaxID=1544867 RepID=UPI001FECEBDD|nr:Sir2 family NAD-dependent protein deacetylase [Paraburkholderia ultramafica]
MSESKKLSEVATWLREADGLLVTAGAGMGVDSGLPDFRGREGFWRAYPALKLSNMNFEDIASPAAIRRMPTLGWGFYGHRLELYRRTTPHVGFEILRRWAEHMEHGLFVFTSNVDGQFQKAGYPEDRVVECHGSIHHLQCSECCSRDIWAADGVRPVVDEKTCRLVSELPTCPRCGAIARPNILMFEDGDWIDDRAEQQRARLDRWLQGVFRPVVIELGAGRAIPTVRLMSERNGPHVIRINPREHRIAPHLGLGIAGEALETLRQTDTALFRT